MDSVTVVRFDWTDVLLWVLVAMAVHRAGRMLWQRRRQWSWWRWREAADAAEAWRSDMLIVLRRPMSQTAVHVDLVRLVERVRLDGAAMSDVLQCVDALLRAFDAPDVADRTSRLVHARLEPVAASTDFLPGAINLLFRDEAELFHSLRSSAVLRASVNQGVLAPPFIVLRQRFARAAAPLDRLRFKNEPRSWSIDIFSADEPAEPVRVEHRRVFECDLFDSPDAAAPSLRFTFAMQLSIALRGAALDEFGIECVTSELVFATPCAPALRHRIEQLIRLH